MLFGDFVCLVFVFFFLFLLINRIFCHKRREKKDNERFVTKLRSLADSHNIEIDLNNRRVSRKESRSGSTAIPLEPGDDTGKRNQESTGTN